MFADLRNFIGINRVHRIQPRCSYKPGDSYEGMGFGERWQDLFSCDAVVRAFGERCPDHHTTGCAMCDAGLFKDAHRCPARKVER